MKAILYTLLFICCTGISYAQQVNNGAYQTVDQKPQPSFDLGTYLNKNMHYPKEAMQKHIEGKVLVRFMVLETGTIKYPTVVSKPLGGGLEEEAIRVISTMPPWKPGKKQGKIVRVYYTQPIQFTLNK